MRFMKTVFFFLLLVIAIDPAARTCGQTESVVNVPSISEEDLAGASQSIYASTPSLTLIPHTAQAHTGKIWLRSAANGLHVWGKIEADEQGFHWPRQKSEMLSSDHVEVWLSASPDVSMLGIGWGNQFGASELASLKDCADQEDPHIGGASSGAKNCERWYNEQLQYRQYLRRLFLRQWLFAGADYSYRNPLFEDFASGAYAGLRANFFPEDLPRELEPKSEDGVSFEIDTERQQETRHNAAGTAYNYYRQTGYHFHLFIPYKAFPPSQQLKLENLYLMVDVFSAAPTGRKMGDFSSTSAARQWGRPATFNHLRLSSPRTFSITPCEYKLAQKDLYNETYPAWFFLPASPAESDLRSTFALINPAGGYMYEPEGVSPEVAVADYFWKPMASGAIACGPNLSWRVGGSITRTDNVVDKERFDALTLPDGWTLVRSGPTASTVSPFGSGACGSCTVMNFDIFAVSPRGEITSALGIYEALSVGPGQPAEADLTIASDWKNITLYRDIVNEEQTDAASPWTATDYCLEGHTYKQCGESKQVQPPDPPHFKEFRSPDM